MLQSYYWFARMNYFTVVVYTHYYCIYFFRTFAIRRLQLAFTPKGVHSSIR